MIRAVAVLLLSVSSIANAFVAPAPAFVSSGTAVAGKGELRMSVFEDLLQGLGHKVQKIMDDQSEETTSHGDKSMNTVMADVEVVFNDRTPMRRRPSSAVIVDAEIISKELAPFAAKGKGL